MEFKSDPHARLAKVFSTEALIGPEEGSELLLQLLRHSFTPEEAGLAVFLPNFYKPLPIEKIARKADKTADDIKPLLDGMVAKGLIRGRGKGYALLPILPGMFENVLLEGGETPWHREFARIANRLYETGYVRRYLEHPTRVVRSIPLNSELGPKSRQIDPDQVEQMIRNHDLMAVLNNCQCRQARHFDGRDCRRADRFDGCLAFGNFARLFIERGGARQVDRDSLRSVVRDRIGKKLVFFTGNVAAESDNMICTCCSCCCHMMGQIISVDPGLIVNQPKYLAVVDEGKCTDCGRCVAACNLLAHGMDGKRHTFDASRCVGCGHCVESCPAAAIDMVENGLYRRPAADFKRLGLRLAPSKIMAMVKSKLKK